MSTRATVIIKDDYNEVIFYRHSDGYPSVTAVSLLEFCQGYNGKNGHLRKDAMQSSGWLVLHGHKEYLKEDQKLGFQSSDKYDNWKVGAYEPTSRIASDAAFIYTINLIEKTLICSTPKYDKKFDITEQNMLFTVSIFEKLPKKWLEE